MQRSAVAKRPASGPGVSNAELLERLEKVEALLAARNNGAEVAPGPEPGPEPSPLPSLPSKVRNLIADALLLERNCLGPKLSLSILSDSIVFRTCPIRCIAQSSSHVFQNTDIPAASSPMERTKCIWLPQRQEIGGIVDKYNNSISYIHHITHGPSLKRVVGEIYDGLQHGTNLPLGSIALLLSLCANVTYLWTAMDMPSNLFHSVPEAHAQAISCIKATLDIVEHCHRNSLLSLEFIQAHIILGFVLCNLEGMTVRVRDLISRSITAARELGLHRLDAPQASPSTDTARLSTLRAEVGRRIWWYLCGSDWMLGRFPGASEGLYTIDPTQMCVNKPQNIDDEDMIEGQELVGKPLEHPTHMSYYLQRLRLAELSREFTERTPFLASSPESLGLENVQDMEDRFSRFLVEAPAFFALDYDLSKLARGREHKTTGFIIQRHVLNLFVHGQRLTLHLPYLARGAIDSTYAQSHEACLQSARYIIQTEEQLEKENMCFAATRLRMTVVLHSVFLASIALLLDVCLDLDAGGNARRSQEIADAWRILQKAKPESGPAAKLLERLGQVLKKHNVSLPAADERNQCQMPSGVEEGFLPLTPSSVSRDLSGGVTPAAHVGTGQEWYSLDSMMELDWDGLLWGLDAPFI